jgi:pSer/pThr/pTyr-binding forkhead associated (FHA) protein
MELDKTKNDQTENPLSDKTQIMGGQTNNSLGKTKIHHDSDKDQPDFLDNKNSAGRKLTGWLVSYTIDPLGVDFKIYEGRNIIGSDPQCDIVISGDSSVSTKHLTILYRMGIFKYKDELSTNGTFVNEVFSEEGSLNDGDLIKVGKTIFKFRTAV